MAKFPIGIQNFGSLRKDGYLYIDKTALIYRLVSEGRYYFLSRPRRFGKSLLISTLESYFQGKKELFKGLSIDKQESMWSSYPVLHLDMNVGNYTSIEALNIVLDDYLSRWEGQYGVETKAKSLPLRFKNVIIAASEKACASVVVLVDEYDKPLLQSFEDENLQNKMRDSLKAFYGILKSMDGYIKFGLFTGITKLSKVSVFSDLNNLNDITMDPHYVEICGITEQEIHQDLDPYVASVAKANNISREVCYQKLRENYDGYHFSEDTIGIYNPFSLLCTLAKGRFKDYWFETGTPTFLLDVMKRTAYPLENLNNLEVDAYLLGSIDSIHQTPIPLLYQSGYLTIKGYRQDFDTYHLGFPNQEVERGFTNQLLPYYSPLRKDNSSAFIINFVSEVQQGKAEQFMQRLETLFADGNYQIIGDAEKYFHNAVYIIFKMLGFYVEVEHHTTDGSIDLLMKTSDYIYIIEFKINQSAEAALNQIEKKQYAKPFEHDSRKLYKLGVNFSTEKRRVDDWKVVISQGTVL